MIGVSLVRPKAAEALAAITGMNPLTWERYLPLLCGGGVIDWKNSSVTVQNGTGVETVQGKGPSAWMQDPMLAWQRLSACDVFPPEWLKDKRRWFYGEDYTWSRGGMHSRVVNFGNPDHPPTVPAAVTLASDPAGIVQAEALAFELASVFELTPQRVAWSVVSRSRIRQFVSGQIRKVEGGGSMRSFNTKDILTFLYSYSASSWLEAPPMDDFEDILGRVLPASARNPASPFRDLISLGYMLGPMDKEWVTLMAPEIGT